MKQILTVLFAAVFAVSANAQDKKGLFKSIYEDLFEYSTIYLAGDIQNPKEQPKDYFVRTNPSGNIYEPPVVVDGTEYYDYDYRYGFGIRKIARFDYEVKGKNYYDGTESNVGLAASNSPIKGFEYLVHVEKERSRDEIFKNHRYFLKHSGKYHIAKIESRKQGKVNFNYKSAELRAKLPIGKKFSFNAGAMYRTHERAYGYNPIEIWLNETDENGWPVNYWYQLGYQYGYTDQWVTINIDGEDVYDYYWYDPQGNEVAYTDLQFRDTIFESLINRYNNEQWDLLLVSIRLSISILIVTH